MQYRHFSDPRRVEESADALHKCCDVVKNFAIGAALYGGWILGGCWTIIKALCENPALREFENSFDNKRE